MSVRNDIHEVLIRYAEGIDRRDFAAVESCFSSDARGRYSGINVGPGAKAIIEFLRANVVASAASTHLVGNVQLEHEADRASTVSSVIAVHLGERPGDGMRAVIRGLRYHDQFVRTGGRWLIVERIHEPRWQADAAGELLTDPSPGYRSGAAA